MDRRIPLALTVGLLLASAAGASEPLPSWNDGASKRAIVGFVERVTTPGGKDFVAPSVSLRRSIRS